MGHDARFGRLVPLAFDVTNTGQPVPLDEADLALIDYQNTIDTQARANPLLFSLQPVDTYMRVVVYPRSDVARTIQLTLTVPQAYLDIDDVTTEVLVPHRALLIGTIWYALEERGEELGQSSMFTEERYRTPLADEIGQDSAEQGEYELVPV